METIQINKTKALDLYRQADKSGKDLLHELIGDKLIFQKITERVKSFEDACEVLGINPKSIPAHPFNKLEIVIKALNEGWKPNWKDSDEYKWYCWFEIDSPSGFRLFGVDYDFSGSAVGSRLCFKSRELAEYAAEQFFDLYKDFMTV